MAPRGARARYCLGSYADWTSLRSSLPLFGYDFCTLAVLGQVLSQATDSGQQQVLSGSKLGGRFASDLVLVQPVYRGGPLPKSLSERQHQLTGWALAIVNGPLLVRSMAQKSAVQFLVISGTHPATGAEPALRSPASVSPTGHWASSTDIYAYGDWQVLVRPAPGSPMASDSLLVGPIGLVLTGILAVGLLGALMASLMTARRRALRMVHDATHSLQSSELRYRTLTSAAPIGILEVLPPAEVTYANPRMGEISGREPTSLLGSGWVEAVHPDDVGELIFLADRVRIDRSMAETTLRIVRPDGELRHVRLSAAPKGQDAAGYVVSIEDISDEVIAQNELAHQVFYDALTSLPNRALFNDRLNLERARRLRGGSDFAVLFLDLDGFKVVNDSLGHEAGDVVLKEIGRRFASGIRAGETAARFSGDEFVFIITNVEGADDAMSAAGRILALVHEPILCGDRELTVTASIGVVLATEDTEATTLLRDADTAMYDAKEAGRNRCALFNEDLHHRSVQRLEVETDLRLALARDEFEVFYQPIIELAGETPFGAEALIRWRHPTRGLVPPMEFIPVAEDSGLIKPIGRWVFEQAVSQLAAWDAQAAGPRLSVLSVNLSAAQLEDPATADTVRNLLEDYGIDPCRISIEVTESVVMADSGSTRRTLEGFKALGTRVAIDDFGTGYSSLAYLHRLPVTTLKIDRAFIERLDGEDDSTPVVRAIVEMGHAMDLRVVAEGVSDGRLRSLVSPLGCDVAQGFFWAKPMPAGEFADWWQGAEQSAAPGEAALALTGAG